MNEVPLREQPVMMRIGLFEEEGADVVGATISLLVGLPVNARFRV